MSESGFHTQVANAKGPKREGPGGSEGAVTEVVGAVDMRGRVPRTLARC